MRLWYSYIMKFCNYYVFTTVLKQRWHGMFEILVTFYNKIYDSPVDNDLRRKTAVVCL
jgi:hypothetical protein